MGADPTKTGAQSAERDESGRFKAGNPGGPGRAAGSRNRVTIAAEELLEEQATRLTARAIQLAMAGDTVALKLCVERLIPVRRERPVKFDLPGIGSTADAMRALGVITAEVAAGRLMPGEAERLARVVQTFVGVFEVAELEARVAEIEQRLAETTR